MEQNRDPRNKPTHLQSIDSQQRKHIMDIFRERKTSSISGAGKAGYMLS
jgi:hypothetical protein